MRDIVKTFDNDTKYRNDFQELENEQEFANKSARLMRKRVNQLKERLLRGKPSSTTATIYIEKDTIKAIEKQPWYGDRMP